MSRGLGRIQRLILDYLDNKAKESKVSAFQTVEAYANSRELSTKLKVRMDVVLQALDSLLIQNRIRLYPNGRKRNRFYGSLILPSLSKTEVFSAVASSLLKKPE